MILALFAVPVALATLVFWMFGGVIGAAVFGKEKIQNRKKKR